jgi:hypothetical protein
MRRKGEEYERKADDLRYRSALSDTAGTDDAVGGLGAKVGGLIGNIAGASMGLSAPAGAAGAALGGLVGKAGGSLLEAKQRGDIAKEHGQKAGSYWGRVKRSFGAPSTSSLIGYGTAGLGAYTGGMAMNDAAMAAKASGAMDGLDKKTITGAEIGPTADEAAAVDRLGQDFAAAQAAEEQARRKAAMQAMIDQMTSGSSLGQPSWGQDPQYDPRYGYHYGG